MYIHITLVHGTGARGAPWTRNSSGICKYLAERFRGCVQFNQFLWSGSNLLGDRLRWAEKLRLELEEIVGRLGTTHIFYIVAHSHGGNVAAYAVAGSDVLRGKVGVICLATPFLVLSGRTGS